MQFFSFGGGSTTDEQQVKEDSVSITRRGRLRQQMVTSIKGHSSKHVQPPPSEKASPLAGAVEGEEDKRLKSKEKSNFSPRKHGSPDSKGALSSKKDARAPESNSNNVVSGRGLTIPIPIQIPSITDGWNMFGGTGNSTAAVEISAAAAHATNGTRTDLNRRKEVGQTQKVRSSRPTTVAKHAQSPPKRGSSSRNSSRIVSDDPSKRSRSRTKRLRVARDTTAAAATEGLKIGRRPLVVTDDMELADVTSLMKEVLERVGENERELRRLRKEAAVAKPRSDVRERKFVIDTRAKMLGAAFAGSIAGMLLGWSILPNLWLLGAVAGAIACAVFSRTTGTIGGLCATAGIQVALVFKDVRDWWEQTVFLYKTGKLSYTYWRVFEKYDHLWGVTDKYTEAVRRLSKEAVDLDRQYQIRSKAVRAQRSVTKYSKRLGSSAVKEVSQVAGTMSEWGTNELQNWGILGEDRAAELKKNGLQLGRFIPYSRASGKRGMQKGGVRGAKTGMKRPLGISVDLEAFFGGGGHSLYSAPAAGKKRKPGYRGDPVIPARIRHLVMTPKQIREERLRKYRVGFMGFRTPRSFDKHD